MLFILNRTAKLRKNPVILIRFLGLSAANGQIVLIISHFLLQSVPIVSFKAHPYTYFIKFLS